MEEKRKASKQNKGIIRALCILLILLVMGTGGYTYAKYMTQEKGTGSADVANWAFKMTKTGEETKTVKLVNTAANSTLAYKKIAPGTSGSFMITLDATGTETNVDYTVRFANEVNKPNNIIFNYNQKDYKTLSEIEEIVGTLEHNGTKTKMIEIEWRWPYETGATEAGIELNDKVDTQNGTSLLDYSFDIIATGTQGK